MTTPMNVFWYLTAPDGHAPWTPEGARPINYRYLQQLARGYDHLGFTGALFATGAHDVWVLGGSLLPHTDDLNFLLAIHPGLIQPTLLAKMAATFQEFSKGRLLLNIVSGDAKMLGAYGMKIPHDERYQMADEYLTIFKRLFAGESVTYEGKYFSVEGAKLALPAGKTISLPPLWFGGSSEPAIEVAAKHVDTYLSWGETPDEIGRRVEQVNARAAHYGRTLGHGVRLYVILRDTDEAAWAEADRLLGLMDDDAIAANQRFVGGSDSVGQRRMSALHGGKRPKHARELEIAPNLWSGLGLVRPGPGTAIVGSPETVIRTLNDYAARGIDTFILSGMPLLEESYRFAEQVLPHLPVRRTAPVEKTFTWSTLFDRDLSAFSPATGAAKE
ncbi:LLM class flavin-dependent oxidoreductase [Burkholderia sp. Ac-20379]|uniref:LLM class flavin-dependent oxidoreductase n=1 Tax=Burkholderia sp. Ac-20379 TaxID=2703900 RepID=UPI001F11FB3C|nr:LLM class flavin-dependent oxidoreductase [Burkholderia sp. Ac-20379]